MRKIVVALILMTVAFAGCTGSDDPADVAEPTPTDTQTQQQNQTATNHAPVLDLQADNTTGEAPFTVTFTINGSDEEGDPILWTFDADGDGTNELDGSGGFPVTYEHTYTEVGSYAARANATDGLDDARGSAIGIQVTEPDDGAGGGGDGGDGGEPGSAYPVSYELATVLPCPDCFFVFDGVTGCLGWLVGQSGLRCDWTVLPLDAAGHAFTLESAGDPDIEFFDTCDGTTATSLGWFSNAGSESGDVPEGAGCAVVYEFGDPAAAITLTIS